MWKINYKTPRELRSSLKFSGATILFHLSTQKVTKIFGERKVGITKKNEKKKINSNKTIALKANKIYYLGIYY